MKDRDEIGIQRAFKEQAGQAPNGVASKINQTFKMIAFGICIASITSTASKAQSTYEPVHEVGTAITVNDAAVMTANFRDKFRTHSYAHLYGKDIINQLLNQGGVEGINFYNALSASNELQLLLVGVAGNENELINGTLGGLALCCPANCGIKTQLNERGGSCAGPIAEIGGTTTLADAEVKTARYRNMYKGMPVSHLFGKDIINQILGEPGVLGLRFYNGINPDGNMQLVMVGVDADGTDLITGTIADLTRFCPPSCGTKNSLNSDD